MEFSKMHSCREAHINVRKRHILCIFSLSMYYIYNIEYCIFAYKDKALFFLIIVTSNILPLTAPDQTFISFLIMDLCDYKHFACVNKWN